MSEPRYSIRPAKSNPTGRLDEPYAVTKKGRYFRTFPTRDAAEAAARNRNEDDAERERMKRSPKTGAPCGCRRGIERDNCPACEGSGWRIDFAAIRERGAYARGLAECLSDVTTHYGPNLIEAYDRGRADGRKAAGLVD